MALIEIKPPSNRDLRCFGIILLVFAAVVGGLLRWNGYGTTSVAVWLAGLIVTGLYYLAPVIQHPLYMTWMYAAFPVGWVVSHVVLAVVFYGIVTPIGFILRTVSHDPLLREFEASRTTYWVKREQPRSTAAYLKQY